MNVSDEAAPVALVTGISGQDGSYLTELLLDKGYVVHGTVRHHSLIARPRLDHLTFDESVYGQRLFLHYADLRDPSTLLRVVKAVQPDELYHLAGQTHVGLSFEIPESTCELVAMATLRLLELIRDLENPPKVIHVSSSEVFGRPTVSPQNETTPMRPVTPYGVAKAFATNMCRVYRESHGLFVCNAICYNHESPRRGESFVTRKITQAAARIALNKQSRLSLGDLNGRRDWGFAKDYVTAMQTMLQQEEPADYVLATGVTHSVRDLLDAAFSAVELDWEEYVDHSSRHVRLAEAEHVVGDPSLAERQLGWTRSLDFQGLVELMVKSDLAIEEQAS